MDFSIYNCNDRFYKTATIIRNVGNWLVQTRLFDLNRRDWSGSLTPATGKSKKSINFKILCLTKDNDASSLEFTYQIDEYAGILQNSCVSLQTFLRNRYARQVISGQLKPISVIDEQVDFNLNQQSVKMNANI